MNDWLQSGRITQFATSLMSLIEAGASQNATPDVFVNHNLTTLHSGYANERTSFQVKIGPRTYAISVEELKQS